MDWLSAEPAELGYNVATDWEKSQRVLEKRMNEVKGMELSDYLASLVRTPPKIWGDENEMVIAPDMSGWATQYFPVQGEWRGARVAAHQAAWLEGRLKNQGTTPEETPPHMKWFLEAAAGTTNDERANSLRTRIVKGQHYWTPQKALDSGQIAGMIAPRPFTRQLPIGMRYLAYSIDEAPAQLDKAHPLAGVAEPKFAGVVMVADFANADDWRDGLSDHYFNKLGWGETTTIPWVADVSPQVFNLLPEVQTDMEDAWEKKWKKTYEGGRPGLILVSEYVWRGVFEKKDKA